MSLRLCSSLLVLSFLKCSMKQRIFSLVIVGLANSSFIISIDNCDFSFSSSSIRCFVDGVIIPICMALTRFSMPLITSSYLLRSNGKTVFSRLRIFIAVFTKSSIISLLSRSFFVSSITIFSIHSLRTVFLSQPR